MTEAGIIATDYLAPKGQKKGSVGVPFGLELKIEEDEIYVRGNSVFRGYETDNGYDRTNFNDGWFQTGDLGYIDEDGYLFITGRIKEMINRGGEKVSPYEVEDLIMKHPDVIDVVVFPWPGDDGIEEIAAVLATKNNRTFTS